MLRRLRERRLIEQIGKGRARVHGLMFPVEHHAKCGKDEDVESHTQSGENEIVESCFPCGPGAPANPAQPVPVVTPRLDAQASLGNAVDILALPSISQPEPLARRDFPIHPNYKVTT
jgi:hypothetical protein